MSDYPKIQPEISQPISENLQKLARLFPAAVKDGELDIEALREELGDFAEIQPGDEKYELNWVGKQAAKKKTFEPLMGKTLALKDDGKNADTTENLYIEGDNLEALKLLRQNYYGEVKMIYIDPPYNTGKDFVYTDKFKVSQEKSEEEEGAVSESGERLVKNEKSSNRFHARWLDMMYPRLKLAKDLLQDDGVIFISLDDNEATNLIKIGDEIFGSENFVGLFPWRSRTAKADVPFGVSNDYEWIICYAKPQFQAGREIHRAYYKSDDFKDRWRLQDLTKNTTKEERPNSFFTLVNKKNGDSFPASETRTWSITEETLPGYLKKGKIVFPGDYDFLNIRKPAFRVFEAEDQKKALAKYGSSKPRSAISNLLPEKEVGRTEHGSKEIRNLFNKQVFSYPKPSTLIKYFLQNCTSDGDLILDFYSGSASTAHALMQLNAEDGKERKFLMVQLDEECDIKSEAYSANFTTIAEIGKERIRRAGKKIKAELVEKHQALLNEDGELELDDKAPETNPYILNPESLDIGFKSFRIEDTKINWLKKDLRGEDIVAEAGLTTADALDFVPGFTDTDVVYELMLRQSNIPLTLPITQPIAGSERTYLYGDSYLICLEETIDKELVEQLAALEPTPLKYFFRDSAFGKDIAFKDETFRRLNAEIAKNHGEDGTTYTVEFI